MESAAATYSQSKVKRSLVQHANAFGFLRLLFASLVIIAHTPELIDGNRQREPLTRIFGTVSFGELAVDSFFVISGYLIVKSYLSAPTLAVYFKNRVLRIYPAFIVASLLCVYLVAPLVGGGEALMLPQTQVAVAKNVLLLQPPEVAGSFTGFQYDTLNGSMWTIAYEFRCYILVALAGLVGLLRQRRTMLMITASIVIFSEIMPYFDLQRWWSHRLAIFVGDPQPLCRLTGMFLVGCLFYLYRDKVHLHWHGALLAAPALALALSIRWAAEPAIAIIGGYLIFFVAACGSRVGLQHVNNKNDVSYGIYLYAWPITRLIIWYFPDLPVGATSALTFGLAYCCGWVSWITVEKPFLVLFKDRAKRWGAIP